MPRTDLENLEKRRWASKYWRELPVAEELYDDLAHANRDFLPERLLR